MLDCPCIFAYYAFPLLAWFKERGYPQTCAEPRHKITIRARVSLKHRAHWLSSSYLLLLGLFWALSLSVKTICWQDDDLARLRLQRHG